MKTLHRFASIIAGCLALVACSSSSSDSDDRPPPTGLTCSNPNQCYSGLDAAALRGNVVCLTELKDGYCTHTCSEDADCCAIAGECANGIKEVCSPVQSAEQKYCVLSCESANLPAGADANAFCRERANPNFTCHSTGGGSQNRKFCGP
ncbi:hypothetical protein LZC95_02055 [Pendulispora brunnea]|uniref:Uncharacterized protein n=1 Tax=Pendulispora brunnea TaxID=2905690 RepID=A0ABZ2KAC2_9BACT